MATVLGVFRSGGYGRGGQPPTLRVQCDHCGRIYVTTCYPSRPPKVKRCAVCVVKKNSRSWTSETAREAGRRGARARWGRRPRRR